VKALKRQMGQPFKAARIARLCFPQSLLLLALFVASQACAQPSDPKEQAMLPSYCRHSQVYRDVLPGGNNPTEIERWKRVMGEGNFNHIHHYCNGLMLTNRALYLLGTAHDRQEALSHSIKEFDYVIARVPGDFSLLPEILTKRGENLMRLQRTPEAISTLNRAIEVKVDYWPPYAALSDHYKEAGDIKTAREWLVKGLAASPEATALERRLRALPQTPR
jgi:tetratricopeptide (TPR) repeat protein